MSTIIIRIPDDLNKDLKLIAKSTARSKSYIIRKAIQNYVLELQKDIEDYNDAMKKLKQSNKTVSWEEVQRNCGLLED